MNFLKSNFWEIERSPRLYHFTAMLAVLHVINYFYWLQHSRLLSSAGSQPLLCWGFFENCARHGFLAAVSTKLFFTLYLIVAVLLFVASLWKRSAATTWVLVALATSLHLFFYLFDASLALDAHGLLLFLSVGYLFVPNKISLVRSAIIVFHLVSAWRELNPAWLAGTSLIDTFPLPLKGLEWVAAMGVTLKMTLPLLLVSPYGQRVALGVVGLLVYHGFIFYFRHDYASLALGGLVLFYAIDHWARKKMEFETLYQSYAMPEPSKLWWPMAVGLYLLIQIPTVRDSSALKLLTISGPPVSMECRHVNFANYSRRTEQLDDIVPKDIGPQARCHPLVAFNMAKESCRTLAETNGFESLSSGFLSRKPNEAEYRTVFMLDNICDPNVTFRTAVNP